MSHSFFAAVMSAIPERVNAAVNAAVNIINPLGLIEAEAEA